MRSPGFNVENTELLLIKDRQLYDEFAHLPLYNKREQMFSLIKKFNERNPLYIYEGKYD
jgi:hypothetical protein